MTKHSAVSLLAALRSDGDEYELTQAIAAVAQSDRAFAAQLAKTLITSAPFPNDEFAAAAPAAVECRAEHRLRNAAGMSVGTVDLLFEEGDWALLVEHKIYSDYEPRQLDRYLDGGAGLGRDHWGLIAVTRDAPRVPEPAAGTPRWLGSLRWADLIESFRSIAPSDARLKELWLALITVETDNGDFGVINLEPPVVRGWARWQEGRSQLETLLRSLVEPAQDLLNGRLAPDRACRWKEHKSSSGLWLWNWSIHARFLVPRDGHERLRVQFLSDDHNELCFTVDARLDDFHALDPAAQDAYREVAIELGRHGFTPDEPKYTYIARAHHPDQWLRDDGRETAALLLERLATDIPLLAEAGAFDERFDLPVSG